MRDKPRIPIGDSARRRQHAEAVIPVCAGAVSGAIVGFLFAGRIPLGFAVYSSVIIGLIAGWWLRSLSSRWLQEGGE